MTKCIRACELKTLDSWRIPISISKTQIIRRLKFGVLVFFSREFFFCPSIMFCTVSKLTKKNFSPENLIQHIENSADPFFANASRQGMLVSWPSVSLGE